MGQYSWHIKQKDLAEKRIKKILKKDIVKYYSSGMSISEMARIFKTSNVKLLERMKEFKIEIRKPGGVKRKRKYEQFNDPVIDKRPSRNKNCLNRWEMLIYK